MLFVAHEQAVPHVTKSKTFLEVAALTKKRLGAKYKPTIRTDHMPLQSCTRL